MPRRLPATALLGTLAACQVLGLAGPDGGESRTLIVQHHAAECMGFYLQLCILVREPDEPQFTYHYRSIEGFTYQWGFVYEIRVEEFRIRNPPQDASSIRTVLRAVVSKERVPPGTEFDLTLTAVEGRVVEVTPDRYEFYYGAGEFTCPMGAGCAELQAQIAAGARIRYRLEHPAAPGDRFTLVQWEVAPGGVATAR